MAVATRKPTQLTVSMPYSSIVRQQRPATSLALNLAIAPRCLVNRRSTSQSDAKTKKREMRAPEFIIIYTLVSSEISVCCAASQLCCE